MLKRCGGDGQHSELVNWETPLQELITLIANKRYDIRLTSPAQLEFKPQIAFGVQFESGSWIKLAIALEGHGQLQLSMGLLNLAQVITRPPPGCQTWLETLSSLHPKLTLALNEIADEEADFVLHEAGRARGNVRFALYGLDALRVLPVETQGPVVTFVVSLSLPSVKDLSERTLVVERPRTARLTLSDEYYLTAEFYVGAAKISLEIKGVNMEHDLCDIPVSLELGQVELSLAEVLKLRPGAVIEFEKPAQFAATLKIGTSVLGRAAVSVDNSLIRLQILESVS